MKLMQRLDRLERNLVPPDSITRIVRTIIGATNGRADPWEPTWAYGVEARELILRAKDETAEAFEARAKETLSSFTLHIGCKDVPLKGDANDLCTWSAYAPVQ